MSYSHHLDMLDDFEWAPATEIEPGDRIWMAICYHASDGDVWTVESINAPNGLIVVRSVETGRQARFFAPANMRRQRGGSATGPKD